MPHIAIKLAPGRSEEQKQELSARIVQDILEVLHAPEAEISLTIEEVHPQDWTKQVYLPEIETKWDKLYKTPGYTPA